MKIVANQELDSASTVGARPVMRSTILDVPMKRLCARSIMVASAALSASIIVNVGARRENVSTAYVRSVT